MHTVSLGTRLGIASLILHCGLASSTAAQTPDSVVPVISERTYTGGTMMVVVKGTFQINQSVEINKPASFSAGDMTWLQFGVSGSPEPNVLITYGESIGEGVGISVGLGKKTATAGTELCDGEVTVAAKLLTGHYTCTGVTSYDSSTGRMGKVDIEIRFTAQS
jgi:hypothetical protein